jgi:hypothetical protein
MKRAVLLLCAVGSVASATTLLALDVDALTSSSDAVVRGRVVSATPRWTRDHLRIVTDTVVEVSETWRGAASGRITVMQPGGEVGEVGQRVESVATFKPGEEVVLFLEARGDRFTVAGLAQGRFVVERSSDGAATFARQDQCGDLELRDRATGQAVGAAPVALTVEALKRRVLRLAPAEPTLPAGPVKVAP